jgi:hypothetical protein
LRDFCGTAHYLVSNRIVQLAKSRRTPAVLPDEYSSIGETTW